MSTEAAGAAEIEGPADRARRDDAAPPLRRSPLDAWHRGHGARMVAFGGWEMPLEFGDGTLSEHMSCRRRAAVFDVSHLGTVRVTGPGAKDRLEHSLTNSLSKIAPGKAQYTHLLDEDGSVLDDLIVWWVDEQRFDVMPNASNTSRVLEAIGGSDVTEQRAVLAVQGPRSRELLAQVFPDSSQVGHFKVATSTWRGAPVVVAGTGYTGEDGVECAVPSGVATEFWAALVAAGATPAGLGPGTRCVWRRACLYTATNWAPGSLRSTPGSPGSSHGTNRVASRGATPCWPSAKQVYDASSGGLPERAGSRSEPGIPPGPTGCAGESCRVATFPLSSSTG